MKILYLGLTHPYDLRVLKEYGTLIKNGYTIKYAGIYRNYDRVNDNGAVLDFTMFERTIPSGIRTIKFIPTIMRYFLSVMVKEKPDVIHCINEEVAFMAVTLNLFLRRQTKIVCDIFDHAPMRVRNIAFKLIMTGISWACHKSCKAIIVTDENRKNRFIGRRYLDKTYILPNYPRYEGITIPDLQPDGKTKILCAGALSHARGILELLEACENINNVEIICAGPIADDIVRKHIMTSHNCKYYGVLSYNDVVNLGVQCDAIFAFYKPVTMNNIYASPNKIYDALLMGRPVIINSETILSRFIEENKLGYVGGYSDLYSLADYIKSLQTRRSSLKNFSNRVRKMGKEYYSWESTEYNLQQIYMNLSSC